MPFVTLKPKATIEASVIDPVLQTEMVNLAALYGDAMRNIRSGVEVAKKISQAQRNNTTNDLRLFQDILASEIIKGLAESMRLVSSGVRQQILRDTERAIMNLPAGVNAKISFRNNDPRAIAWANERSGLLIKSIETEALTAVRGIISNALQQGASIPVVARKISRVVGLHERWQKAVDNFAFAEFQRLVAGGMDAELALETSSGASLTYSSKLINARALTIARTEIMASQNMGQVLSWYQASDDGYLDLSLAEKEWVAGPSGWKGIFVCPICLELDGQQVPVEASFTNGEIMPPAHPNCRCTLNLIPLALLGRK